jgi:hypothetical protein
MEAPLSVFLRSGRRTLRPGSPSPRPGFASREKRTTAGRETSCPGVLQRRYPRPRGSHPGPKLPPACFLLPLHAVQLSPGASPLPAYSSCSAAVAGSLPPACLLFMQCSCRRESPTCLLPLHAVQLSPGASPLPAYSSCSAAVAESLPPACFLFMQCSCRREPPPCLLTLHAVQLVPGASPLPASSSCSAAVAGSLPPACFLLPLGR